MFQLSWCGVEYWKWSFELFQLARVWYFWSFCHVGDHHWIVSPKPHILLWFAKWCHKVVISTKWSWRLYTGFHPISYINEWIEQLSIEKLRIISLKAQRRHLSPPEMYNFHSDDRDKSGWWRLFFPKKEQRAFSLFTFSQQHPQE